MHIFSFSLRKKQPKIRMVFVSSPWTALDTFVSCGVMHSPWVPTGAPRINRLFFFSQQFSVPSSRVGSRRFSFFFIAPIVGYCVVLTWELGTSLGQVARVWRRPGSFTTDHCIRSRSPRAATPPLFFIQTGLNFSQQLNEIQEKNQDP